MTFLEALIAGLAVATTLTSISVFRYRIGGGPKVFAVHFAIYLVVAIVMAFTFEPFGRWVNESLWLFASITLMFAGLVIFVRKLERAGKGDEDEGRVVPLKKPRR